MIRESRQEEEASENTDAVEGSGTPQGVTPMDDASQSGSAFIVWTWLFTLCALALVVTGLVVAYREASIVGADAYNLLIAGARGAVIVGVGICLSVVGAMLAVLALRERLSDLLDEG